MIVRPFEYNDIEQVAIMTHNQFLEIGHRKSRVSHTVEVSKLCLGSGTSCVLDDEGTIRGGLGAILSPNLFQPTTDLVIVMLFIEEEARVGRNFLKVWRHFEDSALKLLDAGKIDRIIANSIPGFTGVDFSKLGMVEIQTTYMIGG